MEFPFGDELKIPTATEAEVISKLTSLTAFYRDEMIAIRENLNLNDVYSLCIFSVRTAIMAVRINSPKAIEISIHCMVMVNDEIDYRDMLRILSIVEACAKAVNLNFERMVTLHIEYASPEQKNTIARYLSRSEEMREPDVMGYEISGAGSNFGFIKIPW